MNPFRGLFWIPAIAIVALIAHHERPRSASADSLDDWAVLGGVERRVESQQFRGGSVLALLGGVKLDLRDAAAPDREVTLDATAILGGVEIIAPRDWEVAVSGTSILGGFSESGFRRAGADEKHPRLIVSGLAVLGGVKVRR